MPRLMASSSAAGSLQAPSSSTLPALTTPSTAPAPPCAASKRRARSPGSSGTGRTRVPGRGSARAPRKRPLCLPKESEPPLLAALRARALRDSESLRRPGADHPLTVLEEIAVGPGTESGYNELMTEFKNRTLRGLAFRVRPRERAERLVMSHLSLLFAEKRAAAEGMKFLAAISHHHPQLGRRSNKLLRARRQLQGYAKAMPCSSRVPPPSCAVAAVAVELCRLGSLGRPMAIATLTAHQCYLRPDELFSLRRKDVIGPTGRRGALQHWCLLLGPLEMRRPTKAGVYDDSVMVDNPGLEWTLPFLLELKQAGPEHECIWPFTRGAFTRAFGRAVRNLGLKSWGFVPYSLRHSGPSADRSEQRLTLEEVQRRGRWQNPKTVMRYERSSRVSALLSTLAPPAAAYLQHCERFLRRYVAGHAALPKMPAGVGGTCS